MKEFGTYQCLLTKDQLTGQGACSIGHDALEFNNAQGQIVLDYADLIDFRLPGYRILLRTTSGEVVLSELGHDTEAFFEQLWNAYMERSKESLFASGEILYSGEGDYDFSEQGDVQHGIAKVELLPDALILCPHDHLSRRIPLCFIQDIVEENYSIVLTLDTGDKYSLRRLGRDSITVCEKIRMLRERISKQWQQAHRELNSHLEEQLGEKASSYRHMLDCGCNMYAGLYRLDGDGFWFAGFKNGKAAVELVTQEQSATYLYTYDIDSLQAFEHSLRHAMESVGLHREVIFTELADKPLYRMTVDRSYHLRFLREHNQGRIVHNTAWEKNISAFFGC
jgi:hypothetical protein